MWLDAEAAGCLSVSSVSAGGGSSGDDIDDLIVAAPYGEPRGAYSRHSQAVSGWEASVCRPPVRDSKRTAHRVFVVIRRHRNSSLRCRIALMNLALF